MGIVNVTPDSFSDGGRYFSPEKAVAHGLRLVEEGADILDIGGESTRPGAVPVTPQEEIDRVMPVIEGLKGCGRRISIDTRHAATMRAALAAGAGMINDVTALTGDPDSLDAARSADVPVCLMHMRGMPGTMQDNPVYEDVVADVFAYLGQRIAACEAAGIEKSRLIVDPGIGFGKTAAHNTNLLGHLRRFHDLGVPLLIGVSRKRFIDALCERPILPQDRVPGSLAAALFALTQGAHIFRVHDVAVTRQAFRVWQGMQSAS